MTGTVSLTPRELDVLRGIAASESYPAIAAGLGVSLENVKSYAARLRRKLGVKNKVAVALWAVKHLGRGE